MWKTGPDSAKSTCPKRGAALQAINDVQPLPAFCRTRRAQSPAFCAMHVQMSLEVSSHTSREKPCVRLGFLKNGVAPACRVYYFSLLPAMYRPSISAVQARPWRISSIVPHRYNRYLQGGLGRGFCVISRTSFAENTEFNRLHTISAIFPPCLSNAV